MSCISSQVKVPQIPRQGLDIADIVDWDLKPHLNIFCILVYIYELKTFFYIFWDLFVFLFHYNKAKLLSTFVRGFLIER